MIATDAGSEHSTTCKMDIYLAVSGVVPEAERNESVIHIFFVRRSLKSITHLTENIQSYEIHICTVVSMFGSHAC
jgi:hypothetical protein